MMYKDKEKQREVTKDRVRRYRDKQKGVTDPEGVTRAIVIKIPGRTQGASQYPDVIELKFSKARQAQGKLPNIFPTVRA